MTRSKTIHVRYAMPYKNRGIALLLMLSLLIVVFTTVAIARLSLNDLAQKRQDATLKALTETRDAIMAWTLTQSTATLPPGSLPCPDTDLDGDSDYNGILCIGALGTVPYITLNIPEPRDGDGARLWYGIGNFYATNSATQVRNSSIQSTLFLNTDSIAFILISQNDALDGQSRGNVNFANRAQFLEGENADADFVYSDMRDENHNDQVLAVPANIFWSTVEDVVLSQVALLLRTYKTQCGAYPWAVNFSDADDNSDNGTLLGRVPLGTTVGTTLPTVWGLGCAPSLPTWLTTHWQRTLFYAMCAPPSAPTSCLQLQDANSVLLQTASVILIAPGIPWGTQNRSILQPAEFFDKENSATIDNVFQKTSRTEHTADFNDTIYIVE